MVRSLTLAHSALSVRCRSTHGGTVAGLAHRPPPDRHRFATARLPWRHRACL